MKKTILYLLMMLFCLSVPAQKGKNQRKPTTTQQTKKKTTTTKKTATNQKKTSTSKTAGKKNNKRTSSKQPTTVKGLQNERNKLQAQRVANQRRQEELKKGVRKGMENLMILDHEIAQKQKVVDTIRNDISRLSEHINLLDRQLEVLTQELEERRNRYMQSMRYMHRNRKLQNQLMFVFSADNFNQMYRRLRFMREYSSFQKAQGEAVISKQHQVEQKRQELSDSKLQKNHLLVRGEQEKQLLEGKQNEQQAQVNQLKKQQKTVEALILEQQRREAELDARIDRLIAEEIAREKARQEAEARRKAAAEAARKRAEEQAQAKKNQERSKKEDTKTTKNSRTESSNKVREHEPAESKRTEEAYTMPSEDRRLSGNFEANRGRLPLPITGAYRLVRGFGTYSPEGLSHVKLQSNGWHLKGQNGSRAQCIFDGEVSGVYYQGGSYIVTVRHGKYISAYINLSAVSVRKGQHVKTRDILGSLGADNNMQFQLRNWNTLLNPAHWLGR